MSYKDEIRRGVRNLLFGLVAGVAISGYNGKGPLAKLAEFKDNKKSLITINIEKHRTVEFNENAQLVLNGKQVDGILPGNKVANPTPAQEFLEKTLEICAQSPMMKSAIETLKEHKIPIFEDTTQVGSSGYYSDYNRCIGIKNTHGDPGCWDVLTMMEEVLHAYDYIKHDVGHKKEGNNFSPVADVLCELNLEASAKARKIAACYEIGGDLWNLAKENFSVGEYAKQYENYINDGKDGVTALAEVYLNMQGSLHSNFHDYYIEHALLSDVSNDKDFSPERAVQYYKLRGVKPCDMKEITHDVLVRAGHIPGTDVNFLAGFKDLAAPGLCVIAADNYQMIKSVNDALGIENTYVLTSSGRAYPASLMKQAQDEMRPRYEASIAFYDSIKENLLELKEECRAVYSEYDAAKETGTVSKELEEKYNDALNKSTFYHSIETGKVYKEINDAFADGHTFFDIKNDGSRSVTDGITKTYLNESRFGNIYDKSRIDSYVEKSFGGLSFKISM